MTIFKAISESTHNKGQFLASSKTPKFINGKLQPVYQTREEFESRLKSEFVETFKIVEVQC